MTTHRLARLTSLALLATLASAAPAAAAGVSVYAGVGPRFSAGDTEAVGALRATFELESLLSFAIEADGYLSAPDPGAPLDLAGGEAGLVADLPLPGPLTPEIGLAVGLLRLTPERHGIDRSLLTVNGELALRLSLGPAKLRVAWTAPIWVRDEALASLALDSQLTFSFGFGF